MIEITRFKERPHLVAPGKRKGKYRCEKNCPHCNGIHICSNTVATAEHNDELLDFLWWFQQSYSRKGVNLSSTVKTDMPKNPGRKGGVSCIHSQTALNINSSYLILINVYYCTF